MNALSVQWQGFLFLLLILCGCAVLVHLVRLALLGYRALTARAKPKVKQEPVYFLVERKKKRSKAEYCDPKRISFR